MREKGFTLVEMVLAILLIGMLAGVAAMTIQHGVRASVETTTRNNTLSKLRLATERIAREVRQVRRNPAAPTDFDFLSRTPTGLSFRRLAENGTTVLTVTVDAATAPLLRLGYDTPPGTPILTDQVSAAQFQYLRSDGVTPASSNADVAFVEFSLTLADSYGNTYPERVRIALRNRQ